jgi:hypothetical protein
VDAALAEKLERDQRRVALLEFLAELEVVDPTPPDVRARAKERADRIRRAIEG